MITGEYVVLDGATALAIPTKYGQSLTITEDDSKSIVWKSYDEKGQIWVDCEFYFEGNRLVSKEFYKTSNSLLNNSVEQKLLKILNTAKKLNSNFLSSEKGYLVETHLDFSRNWGLGTSSTLLNNIAQWAKVDAFKLLKLSFGGSGYDIAAAQNDFPILYHLENGEPNFRKAHLPWEFTDKLFFVHLNEKQDSKEGIAKYRKAAVSQKQIQKITDISNKLLLCYILEDFEKLIESHEQIISEIIGLETVKKKLFREYPHTIKSLGAWGGDFVLVTGNKEDLDYFKDKGYNTIIPFSKMILN